MSDSKLFCCVNVHFLIEMYQIHYVGDRVSTVVEVLCYKPEGRWFDSRWCHWKFLIDIILPVWPWGRLSL